jgi:hypothetical protein
MKEVGKQTIAEEEHYLKQPGEAVASMVILANVRPVILVQIQEITVNLG